MPLFLFFISCEFHADLLDLKLLGEIYNHTRHMDDISVYIYFGLSLGLPLIESFLTEQKG